MTDQLAFPLFADRNGAKIAELLTVLTALRQDMVSSVALAGSKLTQVPPTFLVSAHNLLHYLALRRHDLSPLQPGYSSPAHLSRQFRQVTGLTPTEFQKLGPASAAWMR